MESRTKIIVIVVISCTILVGFICGMVAIFYTADTHPTLEFRPLPRKENAGSTLIRYNLGNDISTSHWIDSLNDFMKPYVDWDHDPYPNKRGGYDIVKCSDRYSAYDDQVCEFDYQLLGDKCNEAEYWGYKRSQSPCIILKMNKMIGWVPQVFNSTDLEMDLLPEDMPDDLKRRIKHSAIDNGGQPDRMIWVSCKGENPADQEFIVDIEYTPWQGFPAYYFPYKSYKGTAGYISPIIAVRFINPTANALINIQCTAWAKNIVHSKKEPSGLVNFELLKD